tara:strand:- start:2626 stop:2808 length:183 start_codon:yes stop_codon:yes gene_type:complete
MNENVPATNYGPITFVINRTKTRDKLIGTTKCGFRSFAYIGDKIEDAKRSILNEWKEKRR